MRAPNANWTAARQVRDQTPTYVVSIDGMGPGDFSTGPVDGLAGAIETLLLPSGLGARVDLLEGTTTVSQITFEILDVNDRITDVVATEADGAPVSTLVNRKVTLHGGYAGLAFTDFAVLFVGHIRSVRMNRSLTSYVFEAMDSTYQISGEIMSDATAAKPTTLRGNPVNVWASILRGVFSTSDADFPLDSVSTATGSSSAPTGLGIADTLLDFTQIKAERDAWRVDDVVEVVFEEPEDALEHLTKNFHRGLQSRAIPRGDGTIGLKFLTPPLPSSATIPTITEWDVVNIRSWTLGLGDHLNRFTVRGDYDWATDTYTTLYSADDTADQSATGETVEYLIESRWLETAYEGVELATELGGRASLTFLHPPAVLEVEVLMTRMDLEVGDVAAVSSSELPDLRTGSRGLTSRLMTVLAISTNFERGLIRVKLLDLGYRRYGVIAPNTVSGDYLTATELERSTFFFLSNTSEEMSNGDPGYRLI